MKLHVFDFRKESMKRFLFALSVLVISTLACQLTGTSPIIQPTSAAPAQPIPTVHVDTVVVVPEEGSLSALYQSVLPGVVALRTETAEGSGLMFDGEGHVVTNQHVVEGVSTLDVTFSSGLKAYGTVIGQDSYADIAVIKVDAPAEEIHLLPIGDSGILQVGQPVVAIGNPFGLNGTMTLGIISGLGRTQPSGL